MQLIRSDTSQSGQNDLLNSLTTALTAGSSVVWLVSGGSNIGISLEIAKQLAARSVDTAKLQVLLVDERYGPLGHADSNYEQLRRSGFLNLGLQAESILQEGLSLEDTAAAFNTRLQKALEQDIVIGQFGIGADGHTAGILPHSPAAEVQGSLATSYVSSPYKRITMTFEAIEQVTQAYVFAFGDDKRAALNQLATIALPLEAQPAQIFKRLARAYVYNDQIGEPA